ncbi:MAG TPA: glycoside hydrolase family 3 C-terminal domain-containing protein, partial [Victivallales bacterium]|nr:glycoside hydrolase family 3 C-terminal domain-containing protein [Victivallales bacterium]
KAISDEARSKFHDAQKKGRRDIYRGLTFWTPNINIFRDPRWGRGQETYGEDPFLTAELGKAFVRGLQGKNKKYLKTAACAKHYAVHSGPEALRHSFNAVVSQKDLYETYLPAFKALVDEGVEAVMGAYNRTNGEPCCGSKTLLIEILREKWGFKGHVVSDCWAIRDFHEHHKVTANGIESAAMAIKNGCDLNCGCVFEQFLLLAYKEGLVSEDNIDNALSNLLRTKFKLGLFDPEESNPYSKIPISVIRSKKHISLARKSAVKSIILLKNSNNLLPLKKDLNKIYVCGPNATNIDALTGNYYGLSDCFVSVLEGIARKVSNSTKLDYRKACLLNAEQVNPHNWGIGEAKDSDAVIFVGGIDSTIEGEEGDAIASQAMGDRPDLNLPKNQIKFLQELRTKSPNTKIIFVLMAGSPVIFPEELVDAAIFAGYPGEQGGNAVADIIFGDSIPSGKLPFTIPKSVEDLPPYEDYSMENRTYRYSKAEPLYPFGFGLSYAKISLSNLLISNQNIKKNSSFTVTFNIENHSELMVDETVQLYISYPETTFRNPIFALKGFEKIKLKPREKKTISLKVTKNHYSTVNEEGDTVILKGKYKLFVGVSSPAKKSFELGAPDGLWAEFFVS